MSDIYDKKNYSAKTIETYEILAAYFVDIFYNHLYNEATKLKINNTCASITEGYKHALNAFIKGLNNAKLYKKYIIGIHQYYTSIGFASISFSKCIDRVTQEFIPVDYFNSLSSTQKMGVMRLILNSSLKQFITIIIQEHLRKIIDYHKDIDNARLLQDSLINCFILERESMYQRFISSYNDNNDINTKLINKMQQDIKKLVKEKIELRKKNDQLIKLVLIKKKNEEKYKENIYNLNTKIEELKKNKNNNIIKSNNTICNNTESAIINKNNRPNNTIQKNDFIEINNENLENIISNSNNIDESFNYNMESETTLTDFLN